MRACPAKRACLAKRRSNKSSCVSRAKRRSSKPRCACPASHGVVVWIPGLHFSLLSHRHGNGGGTPCTATAAICYRSGEHAAVVASASRHSRPKWDSPEAPTSTEAVCIGRKGRRSPHGDSRHVARMGAESTGPATLGVTPGRSTSLRHRCQGQIQICQIRKPHHRAFTKRVSRLDTWVPFR